MFYLPLILGLFLTDKHPKTSTQKVNLLVEVQDIRTRQGAIFFALFRPDSRFPSGKPAEGKKLDAQSSTIQAAFSVEPGEYAIAVFHDENGNGKMDKGIFGIPKEPYGLSNNFRPTFSAPKFKDCQFSVGDNGKTIHITLD
ncbi:DUF2141 domain-containing protein [Spirosoma areae]